MTSEERAIHFSLREDYREQQFKQVWGEELDDVFSDLAVYYDRANHVASLGLLNWLRDRFISRIDVQSGQKVLDVCGGTNAIGIALLTKQPDLKVHAMDRSKAMQAVGQERGKSEGLPYRQHHR